MGRFLKWVGIAIAVFFVAAQFYRPERANPPVQPERSIHGKVQVPADVAAIFNRACDDCHSNGTKWPWYSQVAPVSWLVASDVRDGRRHVNFSDWNQLDRRGHPKDTKKQLEKICEQVNDGDMPITAYKLVHHDARLSAQEEKAICDWTKQEIQRLTPQK